MLNDIKLDFPVSVYGNLEKYNDTISKGRCRIFYKGGNRNGTFITDEFAEKLLSTISYAPVKGIFDSEEGDYTDHGTVRTQGRIYGIVPENPNLAWEDHVDEDGVVRTYACVDVLIFTGLYAEANSIVGKSQSMEIYPPSIKGEWKIIGGKKYYVFESGHFLGLQVLGNVTEPCFEGAAFYAMYNDLKKIVEQIEKYNLNLSNGGKAKMLNYKLSDNAKFNALWSLLNVNYCEEAGWVIEFDICEIYDEYAVVRNYAEGIFERIYYTKNDETDSIEITSRTRCYIMDVSESEKSALEALHNMGEGTYEKIAENLQAAKDAVESANNALNAKNEEYEALNSSIGEMNTIVENLTAEKSNFETKIGELEESISTLTTERDDALTQLDAANVTINSLTETNASLSSFKAEIEKQQKQAIIEKYSVLLDEEVINTYSDNIDQYTINDLDKELAYELVRTNQSVFSSNGQGSGFIPKEETVLSGLEEILSKYKKN